MNTAKIYSQATGRAEQHERRMSEEQPQFDNVGNPIGQSTTGGEKDAGRQQAKLQWMQSSVTMLYMERLREQKEKLIDEACQLAVNYPQHENHNQIIHKLVRAMELAQQIQTIKNL